MHDTKRYSWPRKHEISRQPLLRVIGLRCMSSGGDLAPSLGGRKIFSRTKISELRFFRKKISIFTPKIYDDFLFSHRPGFQILRFFTVLNVVYDPFFTRKTTISEKNSLIRPCFYYVPTFARIRQLCFSKYFWD